MTPYLDKGAIVSACGRYRYKLWREWRSLTTPRDNWRWLGGQDGKGHELGEPKSVLFVMLNPSTADGELDDPTIRRCVRFARDWGYDRLEVVNLFAWRATDPHELYQLGAAGDPVGLDNKHHIQNAARKAGLIIAAWGAHGGFLDQAETARGWIEEYGHGHKLHHLGLTREGHPRHPLYLKSATQPVSMA